MKMSQISFFAFLLIINIFGIVHACWNIHNITPQKSKPPAAKQDHKVSYKVIHEQVHLSLGVEPSEMLVTWVTIHHDNDPYVRYWKCDEQLQNRYSYAERTLFEEGSTRFYVYRAAMKDLQLGEYGYQVGGRRNSSKVFHFRTHPKDENWLPQLLIYGDLGLQDGKSLPYLREDINKNRYDTIFHIGDFAYDLHDNNGQVGHDFMNQIEPVAATIPYMTCAGNHEHHSNFSHYNARFTMLGDRQAPEMNRPLSGRLNNQFYSLDMGPAHIIVFSSEFYFYSNYFGTYQIEKQYKWLEEDLKEANKNREKVPWIIVMAHRPLYCFKRDRTPSCNPDIMEREELTRGIRMWNGRAYGLEDLFYDNGVDLQFYGHEHYYTRTLPVYNPTLMKYSHKDDKKNGISIVDPGGPIHIITGSAGNKEHHPQFNPKVDTVNWIGHHQPDYGYTRLIFKEKFVIEIEQISADRQGKVTDDFQIIKTPHSPVRTPGLISTSSALKHKWNPLPILLSSATYLFIII